MDDPSLPCHPTSHEDASNPTLHAKLTDHQSLSSFDTHDFTHKSQLSDVPREWLAQLHADTDDDALDDPNDLTPRRARTCAGDAVSAGHPFHQHHGRIQAPVFTPDLANMPTTTCGDFIGTQEVAGDRAWWRIPVTGHTAHTYNLPHNPHRISTFRTDNHGVNEISNDNPFYDPSHLLHPFPSAYAQRELSHGIHPLTIRNLHTCTDRTTHRSHPSIDSSHLSDISSESSFSAGCPSPTPYYNMQPSGKQPLPATPDTSSLGLAEEFSYLNSPHPIEDDDVIVDIGAMDEMQAPYTAWPDRSAVYSVTAGSDYHPALHVNIASSHTTYSPPSSAGSYCSDNSMSIDPRITMPPNLKYSVVPRQYSVASMFEPESYTAGEGGILDDQHDNFEDDLYYDSFEGDDQAVTCLAEEDGPSGSLAAVPNDPVCSFGLDVDVEIVDTGSSSPSSEDEVMEEDRAVLPFEESSDDDYCPSPRRTRGPSTAVRAKAGDKKVATRSTRTRSSVAVPIHDEGSPQLLEETGIEDTGLNQGVVEQAISKVIISPAELTFELLPRRTVKTSSWETEHRARRTAKLIHSDKLLSLVHCGKYTKFIYWNKAGDLLWIPDENKFTKHVMPLYFDADQWLSFKRQNGSFGIKHGVQQVGTKQVATLYNPALTRDNDDLWHKVSLLPKMTSVNNSSKPSRTDNKIQDLEKSRDALAAKCAALETTVDERDKELESLRKSMAQLDQDQKQKTAKMLTKRRSKSMKQTFEVPANTETRATARIAENLPGAYSLIELLHTAISDCSTSEDHQFHPFVPAIGLSASLATPLVRATSADLTGEGVPACCITLHQDTTLKGKRKLSDGTSLTGIEEVSRYERLEERGEDSGESDKDVPLVEKSKKDKGKARAVEMSIRHKRSRQF